VDWTPLQQQQQPPLTSSSAAHQLIHGLPPTDSAAPIAVAQPLNPVDHEGDEVDESVDDEEEEEEMGDDEGYRTHSSSSSSGGEGSPQSTATASPPPRVAANVAVADHLVVARKSLATAEQSHEARISKKMTGGEEGGVVATATGSGSSLMWLLDFKLDFFNEGGNNNGQQQQLQQHQQQQLFQQLQVSTALQLEEERLVAHSRGETSLRSGELAFSIVKRSRPTPACLPPFLPPPGR